MNQSRLPEAFEEENIFRMLPGDEAYTVPWAMYAEKDRTLWINSNYSILDTPSGTVTMKIVRTSDGVIVDSSTLGDHKFEANGPYYVGEFVPLPVSLK